MQKIRCKFIVQEVARNQWNSKVTLTAVHSVDTPENERFTKATPSGSLIVTIDNPPAAALLEPGKELFLDLIPVGS